jgi:hypothetical protein
MRWLSGLLQEVEKIAELEDSDKEIDGSLTPVEVLPENIRKLFTYCFALGKRIQELTKEAEETDSRQAARELRRLLKRMEVRKMVAVTIMWEEIKFEFKDRLDPDRSLFICKGWVLCMAPAGPAEMPSFLRGMMGMGE